MKTLSLQIASCNLSVQQMNGTIEVITSDLSDEKERVDEHQGDIKKLQNTTENQTTRLNVLASDEEKIISKIILHEGEGVILEREIVSLNLRLDQLQSKIQNCCS